MNMNHIVIKKENYKGRTMLRPVSNEAKFLCNLCERAGFSQDMINVIEVYGLKLDVIEEELPKRKELKY